jgi:two-component system cell cycle sensor histidine kinase/response regulator CckA
MQPSISELMAELTELLAADDARAALVRAQGRLTELGIEAKTSADRQLELRGADPMLRSHLTPLLELGLLRALEQEEHTKTRERLQMLSEASFEGILVHVDNVVIDVNQRLADMMRSTPADLLGPETVRRSIAPQDLPQVLARAASGYEGTYTLTAVRADGTQFRAELQSKQGRLGERPVRIVAIRDVTERERTLLLLRESEKHLLDLALAAFDFMIVTQNSILVEVGGKFHEMLGYTREEMLGRQALDFVASGARAHTAQAIQENRLGVYESIALAKDGSEIPVEVMGVHSTHSGHPARVAGFRDLREARRLQAERRKLEQQLERSQRLDSLGVLAGGVAHDFNNLLVGVIGNASLLLSTLTDEIDREAATAILTAGERAAALTKQMLAYAGRQPLGHLVPVDMAELFAELRTLLGATLSKKANLRFSLAKDSLVLGDRGPLTQVMMNLLTNASDALAGKPGKIEVRTRRVELPDARWADALPAPVGPGDWLLIEVEDDGVGMDDATRQRVFEPFFSTKESGHGLGLAACLGIVSSHGGALLLESAPGRGSCFSVLLCAASPQRTTQPPQHAAGPDQPCRVLVIDDEELVRSQLRRLLERRGYHVDEAADGASGIEAQARAPADVLIIDVTMPDMDGVEVVQRIRATDPHVAIVLSSGYHTDGVVERLDAGSFQVFLPKPYVMNELLQAVERARARARSGLGAGGSAS